MMIGVCGDFHIPSRASIIPEWILSRLSEVDMILCTGDLTSLEVLKTLEKIAKIYCVKGNMDSINFPPKKILEIEGKKIALTHGSSVYPRGNILKLYDLAKSFGAQVLIHGHTHRLDVQKYRDILLLNPGSATGVWSGGGISPQPSMILLDVGEKIKVLTLERDLVLKKYVF